MCLHDGQRSWLHALHQINHACIPCNPCKCAAHAIQTPSPCTRRDYNRVLRELGGESALRGPAGPDGRPLRGPFNRFELTGPEFAAWAAQVAEQAGYEVGVFGFGRAAGDGDTKAAAAAAGAGAGAASGGAAEQGEFGAAHQAADVGGAAGSGQSAAELAQQALGWADAASEGAAAGAGAGLGPLPAIGYAMHAAVWVRKDCGRDGGETGAAMPGPFVPPAVWQRYWGPHVIVAQQPWEVYATPAAVGAGGRSGGGAGVSAQEAAGTQPEAMEQV